MRGTDFVILSDGEESRPRTRGFPGSQAGAFTPPRCVQDDAGSARIGQDPHEPGFTLIELLLVLVILATLAAIVTPKFTKRSEQARITAARTQISQLEVALDAFEIDVGRYPTTAEGLRALVDKPASDAEGWQQAYLKRDIPRDPWGNDYVYRFPGQYNLDGYDLHSYGPDRKQGGDDDITNWSEE